MYKEIKKENYYKVKGDLLLLISNICKCIDEPYALSSDLPFYLGKLAAMYEKSYIEEITHDK